MGCCAKGPVELTGTNYKKKLAYRDLSSLITRSNDLYFGKPFALQEKMPSKKPRTVRPIVSDSSMTPLPVVVHHQHKEIPHEWSSPLFSFANIPRYASAVLCPCALLSEISGKLLSMPKHSPGFETSCCTAMAYCLFPCIYQGTATYIQYMEDDSNVFDGLLDYIYYTPPANGALENGSPAHIGLMVCLGSACVIPATCIVRQITTVKYGTNETMWTSGLVSCFAWPCGLVQVAEELNFVDGMS